MKRNDEKSLSIFISLILRHKPEEIGLKLEENGWVSTKALIDGINRTGRSINMASLEKIVGDDEKQRYSFNEDKSKIRANQGHSVKVNIEFTQKKPPEALYHGTADRFLDSIMKEGLISRSRQFVHLSSDVDTAIAVGKRHGKPIVLTVEALKMYEQGHKFFLSENNVWLVEKVPVEFIKNMDSHTL